MLWFVLTAINYSPTAVGLWQTKAIAPDKFKMAVLPEHLAAGQLPRYFHFPFDAGDEAMGYQDWDLVARLLGETGTPYINVHLNARFDKFPGLNEAGLEPLVRERFLRNISNLVNRFGAERVIAENVVYHGPQGPFIRCCVDPLFTTGLLEETGVGLLLDTAHARLTCFNLGLDVMEYVRSLPLGRLKEWHITGISVDGPKQRDSMPMDEFDWEMAAAVLGLIKRGDAAEPWLVALEYGGTGPVFDWRCDPAVMTKEMNRLTALLAR